MTEKPLRKGPWEYELETKIKPRLANRTQEERFSIFFVCAPATKLVEAKLSKSHFNT
jgi:hypothetical protein